MKKKVKKLVLSRETVQLVGQELTLAHGGSSLGLFTCHPELTCVDLFNPTPTTDC